MKDVKKLLKKQAESVLPDDAKVKQGIARELGFAEREQAALTTAGTTAAAKSKTKTPLLVGAGALLLAIVLFLALALPALLRGESALPGGNKFLQITSADDFYAYGAASVATLIASEEQAQPAAQALSLSAGDGVQARAAQDRLTAEQEATVNEYLALVESLLSDGAIRHETVQADESTGYRYAMTVTGQDLLGGKAAYTLYFNETLTATGADGGETEEEYSIEGVLDTGEGLYSVSGGKKTESEQDESESELWFRAETGENSYIRVEQEWENETEDGEQESEQKYVYTIVRGGKVAERTAVEYETEQDELELKMTVEKYGADGEKQKDELEFKKETEKGKTVLEVRARMNGEETSFRIFVENGKYRYEFSDGSSSDHDRYGRDEDDD